MHDRVIWTEMTLRIQENKSSKVLWMWSQSRNNRMPCWLGVEQNWIVDMLIRENEWFNKYVTLKSLRDSFLGWGLLWESEAVADNVQDIGTQ